MEVVGEPLPPRDYRLFLSYSRVDKWVPRNYVEPLQRIHGLDVFYDGEINPGERFFDQIIDSLRSADELLVVLSPSSAHRPWVLVEIGMALALGIPIVPILHGYTYEESSKSPAGEFLAPREHIDGPEEFDAYLSALHARCSCGRG